VDELTRHFLVKVSLDNQERVLKPGAFATVKLTIAVRENRPSLPEEALIPARDGYMVFVVENQKARQRKVRIGKRQGQTVEILEGLAPGEIVVRTGHMRLSDGEEVSIGGKAADKERAAL
jgi:membrane fusion protein (multidrug efflux system)